MDKSNPSLYKSSRSSSPFVLFLAISFGLHACFLLLVGFSEPVKQGIVQYAQKQSLAATKAKVTGELRKEFNRLVQKNLSKADADQVWQKVVQDMDENLSHYSQALADPEAKDSQLKAELADLDKKMVAELAREVHDWASQQVTEKYLEQIKKKVVRPAQENYRQEEKQAVDRAVQEKGSQEKSSMEEAFREYFQEHEARAMESRLEAEFKKSLNQNYFYDPKAVAQMEASLKEAFQDEVPGQAGQTGKGNPDPSRVAGDKKSLGTGKAKGKGSQGPSGEYYDHLVGQFIDDWENSEPGTGPGGPHGLGKGSGKHHGKGSGAGQPGEPGEEGSGEEQANGQPGSHGKGSGHGQGGVDSGNCGTGQGDEQGQGGANELLARLRALTAKGKEGQGIPSGGSAPLGGYANLREQALNGGQLHRALRFVGYFNQDQYDELTKALQGRSKNPVQGDNWVRISSSGAVSRASAAMNLARSNIMVIPEENAGAPVEIVEEKPPYQPNFKTIRFTFIPYLNKPIKLDGDLSEWKDIPELPMEKDWIDGSARNPYPAIHQSVKAAWNNKGFYFAFDVTDPDKAIDKAHPDNFWESDCAEIWFDSQNLKEKQRGSAGVQQFWVWPFGGAGAPGQAGGEAVVHLVNKNEQSYYQAFGSGEIQRSAKQTSKGWSMEAFIPAERIQKLNLQPGRIMGFNIDVLLGNPLEFYWAGNSDVRTSMRPDTWGDVMLSGSDAKVSVVAKLTSELSPGQSTGPSRSLTIGEPLKIQVIDPDMNLSPNQKDKVSVLVRTASGAEQAAVLEETGNDTGVFEGAIPTTLALGEPVSGKLPVYEGETIEVGYVDQVRSNASQNCLVKLTVPTSVGATDLAGR